MKSLKKGIALVAVLAFLITAALPAAGLAADVTARIEPQTMTAGEAKTISIPGGFEVTTGETGGVSAHGTYSASAAEGASEIQASWIYVVPDPENANLQIMEIRIPAEAAGFDTPGGPYNYTITWTRTGSSVPRNVADFTLTVESSEPAETYAVTAGEGVASVDPAEAAEGAAVTVTPDEPEEGMRVTAVTAVTEDGTEIAATANPDGTWTFTMPAGAVTVTATFGEAGELYEVTVNPDAQENVFPNLSSGGDNLFYAGDAVTFQANAELENGDALTTLTATAADGTAVPITQTDSATSTYGFTMPAADVEINAIYSAPKENIPVEAGEGVTVSPETPAFGDEVTVTVPDGAEKPTVTGEDGTVYELTGPVKDADGNDVYTFTMPNQSVSVGNPKAPSVVSPVIAVNTGAGAVDGTPGAVNPFYYWTQPNAGLFNDGENNGTLGHPSGVNEQVPVIPANPDGSMKAHFQVGPTGCAVCGGGTENLTLNDRIQIYFDPSNICAEPVAGGYAPLNNCNWSKYVSMEWEYKPSTKDEDDGNPLKIPTGFGFSGVRSPMLTISPLTEAMDGWWVRLAIYPNTNTPSTSSGYYWTTRWIRIDINGVDGAQDPKVTITSDPAAVGSTTNVSRGGDVTFRASVSNKPYGSTDTYQWQSLAQPTAAEPTPSWVNVEGATNPTLTIPNVTNAMSGVSYQCVVTCTQSGPGGLGTVTSSNYLTLRVTPPDGSVYVTASNPDGSSLITKFVGETLQAQISAKTDNGDPVKYQWFVRSYQVENVPLSVNSVAEAAAYLAGAAANAIPGATGASLTSEPLQEGVYGFSCRVENANNAAQSVNSPIIYVVVRKTSLVVYPEQGDIVSVGCVNGQSLTLEASAKASNVTYTWERYNAASGQWTTLTATGQKLVLPALTTTATGTLYRCAIRTAADTTPIYTGWYLINVWDTATTPVITGTSQNRQWALSRFENDLKTTDPTLPLIESSAKVAQDLEHGTAVSAAPTDLWANKGPVYAVWYKKGGNGDKVVAASFRYDRTVDSVAFGPGDGIIALKDWADAGLVKLFQSKIDSPDKGSYTSRLQLDVAAANAPNAIGNCPSAETVARMLNGTYYCVWYKPQTQQEVLEKTAYEYFYGDQSATPINMSAGMHLLAPQETNGETAIRIEVPGDPWIITDLPNTATVSVGSNVTLSVAAAITQPSDTKTPVYTWQVQENGGNWRNCLSSDGTGQFTSSFTTRTITQGDYDENKTLTYRVIVASRPNIAKIVSNECTLQITEGTPQAPVITPGEGSPITIEDGLATGITVSKEGTTRDEFLSQLNMAVLAGYSLRIMGSDGEELASDDIVYTGCVLQLVNDADDSVADMATIIVAGDVLGTGIIGINQVVRMAQDLNGSRPLEGIYAQAGDFNGSGSIDIADLVREAQILSEPIDVQK